MRWRRSEESSEPVERTLRQEQIDDLVAEAQRLRDELLKGATRLEMFAAQLTSAVHDMRDAADMGDSSGEDSGQ